MKKVLGLDLGTTSIGWAIVNEAETTEEKSSIIKLGVRVVPLSTDEIQNFDKGKSITTEADRTLKRGMRRNLQRYKLRRTNLIEILKKNKIITDDTILSENGNKTTFETYRLRAEAATEEISLEQFARVLLMINKKRGYKSNRKVNKDEDGTLIDGMDVAKTLYEKDLTPGELSLQLIKSGKKHLPDFYRSDLQVEFDKIWEKQKQFYPELLTDEFKKQIAEKSKTSTIKIFLGKYKIFSEDIKGKDKRSQLLKLRVDALENKLTEAQLASAVSDINGEISSSSGYLGKISDRSKELYFNKITVGQYKMSELGKNPNCSLKNQTFYRQDYLDEFERIWETQAKYHTELTPELKKEIRDVVIFYQRHLKSQKGLIGICELERKVIKVDQDGKERKMIVGSKVCPKSSPFYQEFRIWQRLNDLIITNSDTGEQRPLSAEEKTSLYKELNIKEKLSKSEILKVLFGKEGKLYELNFKEIIGNRTAAIFFKTIQNIVNDINDSEYDFTKEDANKILELVKKSFDKQGYNKDLIIPESAVKETDSYYQLWHLIYSYEGDKSRTGNESLINKISRITKMPATYSSLLAKIIFEPDYGEISAKAIQKILPYMSQGYSYSDSCKKAGYNHSIRSLSKEQIENKVLAEKLEILPKNTLRNPVVEKILNQMINVINQIAESYGKPDEIRIELARELKQNAEQREQATKDIESSTKQYEEYRKMLSEDKSFCINGTHISRNDLIKYRLYLELKDNGFKTLYSNTYISPEKLFSKDFDIEHIIPKARLFDDSFSNKTLETKSCNEEKDYMTAMDYIESKKNAAKITAYLNRIEQLAKDCKISWTKYKKLKMHGNEIPDDFINRDLGNTQYISKKASEILSTYVKNVVLTTGSITDRLRDDWQLVNVMQELNWNKYNKLGLTDSFINRDGKTIRRIKDWTKRNDNRHHAMDALTIAFTKRSHIQYLNNLNARSDKSGSIYAIEKKELTRANGSNKQTFNPPMPLDEFRTEAKKQLENILVSIKPKNKVVTENINKTKKKNGFNKTTQLTPRGQLHNETIYGCKDKSIFKEVKIGSSLTKEIILTVSKPVYKEALLKRLEFFEGDPKKAFTGKNSIEKNPIYLDDSHINKMPEKVKTIQTEKIYTIRKAISDYLNVDKSKVQKKIDKIVGTDIKRILNQRLEEYGGDSKKAFSNLDENPIWLNKEKGIDIKRVTVDAINVAIPIHDKKDKEGRIITDSDGNTQPADFVSTGNNHHIAIFQDENGDYQEVPVSFFEATVRAADKQPVIDTHYKEKEGWKFIFSLKQNEYFVFPNAETGFDPSQIDLMNPKNYAQISKNLYRVQKIASKDYFFRHHLETKVDNNNALMDFTFKRIQTTNSLKGIVKVRINHIGEIVKIGE